MTLYFGRTEEEHCKRWEAQKGRRDKELSSMLESGTFVSRSDLRHTQETYFIHDNGGRPFEVVADHESIHVHKNTMDDDEPYDEEPFLTITDFEGYWSGFDSSPCRQREGSSILIKVTDNRYISIGWEIYRFDTQDDVILDYVSPIGNSDVPYPVAWSKDKVYFMLSRAWVKREDLKTPITVKDSEELHGEFYRKTPDNKKHAMQDVVVIQKRVENF